VTYDERLASLPPELTDDPLWRMEVYRLAVFAGDLAWHDVCGLVQDKRTVSLANQLYRDVGSISANVAEGYSRRSGKDQGRFCEYSLRSAREARLSYYQGRHVLSEAVATHRMRLLTGIIRLLLTIISAERGRKLREDQNSYATPNTYHDLSATELLDNPPMP